MEAVSAKIGFAPRLTGGACRNGALADRSVMGVTERIAHFVVETSYESIPKEAISVAKTAILDSVGVTLAGSKEESARICAQLVPIRK